MTKSYDKYIKKSEFAYVIGTILLIMSMMVDRSGRAYILMAGCVLFYAGAIYSGIKERNNEEVGSK